MFSGQARGAVKVLAEKLEAVHQSPSAVRLLLRSQLVEADGPVFASTLAAWAPLASYYGDTELALEILRKAYVRGGDSLTVFLWHPLLADVRRTSGFHDLVVALGLPDYWREFGWPDHCRPVNDSQFECS
jgi:hypothetical protein